MELILYVALGFVAQLIDGTLGMAYGVSSNTFLRTIAGLPSVVSSACVHFSEIFTTLVSGLSHLKLRNVSRKLFYRLLVPGVIGGALGAYLLSAFSNQMLDLVIDIYLVIMGVIIFTKAFKRPSKPREYGAYAYALGFVGGLSDAMGGGGWGPIVTGTLIASGHDTRKTVGSVNAAEFFVTIAETTTFAAMVVDFKAYSTIILGLIIGGIIAAPLGAILCAKLPVKWMMRFVGVVIIALNLIKLAQHAGF